MTLVYDNAISFIYLFQFLCVTINKMKNKDNTLSEQFQN